MLLEVQDLDARAATAAYGRMRLDRPQQVLGAAIWISGPTAITIYYTPVVIRGVRREAPT